MSGQAAGSTVLVPVAYQQAEGRENVSVAVAAAPGALSRTSLKRRPHALDAAAMLVQETLPGGNAETAVPTRRVRNAHVHKRLRAELGIPMPGQAAASSSKGHDTVMGKPCVSELQGAFNVPLGMNESEQPAMAVSAAVPGGTWVRRGSRFRGRQPEAPAQRVPRSRQQIQSAVQSVLQTKPVLQIRPEQAPTKKPQYSKIISGAGSGSSSDLSSKHSGSDSESLRSAAEPDPDWVMPGPCTGKAVQPTTSGRGVGSLNDAPRSRHKPSGNGAVAMQGEQQSSLQAEVLVLQDRPPDQQRAMQPAQFDHPQLPDQTKQAVHTHCASLREAPVQVSLPTQMPAAYRGRASEPSEAAVPSVPSVPAAAPHELSTALQPLSERPGWELVIPPRTLNYTELRTLIFRTQEGAERICSVSGLSQIELCASGKEVRVPCSLNGTMLQAGAIIRAQKKGWVAVCRVIPLLMIRGLDLARTAVSMSVETPKEAFGLGCLHVQYQVHVRERDGCTAVPAAEPASRMQDAVMTVPGSGIRCSKLTASQQTPHQDTAVPQHAHANTVVHKLPAENTSDLPQDVLQMHGGCHATITSAVPAPDLIERPSTDSDGRDSQPPQVGSCAAASSPAADAERAYIPPPPPPLGSSAAGINPRLISASPKCTKTRGVAKGICTEASALVSIIPAMYVANRVLDGGLRLLYKEREMLFVHLNISQTHPLERRIHCTINEQAQSFPIILRHTRASPRAWNTYFRGLNELSPSAVQMAASGLLLSAMLDKRTCILHLRTFQVGERVHSTFAEVGAVGNAADSMEHAAASHSCPLLIRTRQSPGMGAQPDAPTTDNGARAQAGTSAATPAATSAGTLAGTVAGDAGALDAACAAARSAMVVGSQAQTPGIDSVGDPTGDSRGEPAADLQQLQPQCGRMLGPSGMATDAAQPGLCKQAARMRAEAADGHARNLHVRLAAHIPIVPVQALPGCKLQPGLSSLTTFSTPDTPAMQMQDAVQYTQHGGHGHDAQHVQHTQHTQHTQRPQHIQHGVSQRTPIMEHVHAVSKCRMQYEHTPHVQHLCEPPVLLQPAGDDAAAAVPPQVHAAAAFSYVAAAGGNRHGSLAMQACMMQGAYVSSIPTHGEQMQDKLVLYPMQAATMQSQPMQAMRQEDSDAALVLMSMAQSAHGYASLAPDSSCQASSTHRTLLPAQARTASHTNSAIANCFSSGLVCTASPEAYAQVHGLLDVPPTCKRPDIGALHGADCRHHHDDCGQHHPEEAHQQHIQQEHNLQHHLPCMHGMDHSRDHVTTMQMFMGMMAAAQHAELVCNPNTDGYDVGTHAGARTPMHVRDGSISAAAERDAQLAQHMLNALRRQDCTFNDRMSTPGVPHTHMCMDAPERDAASVLPRGSVHADCNSNSLIDQTATWSACPSRSAYLPAFIIPDSMIWQYQTPQSLGDFEPGATAVPLELPDSNLQLPPPSHAPFCVDATRRVTVIQACSAERISFGRVMLRREERHPVLHVLQLPYKEEHELLIPCTLNGMVQARMLTFKSYKREKRTWSGFISGLGRLRPSIADMASKGWLLSMELEVPARCMHVRMQPAGCDSAHAPMNSLAQGGPRCEAAAAGARAGAAPLGTAEVEENAPYGMHG